jgi:nitrogen fixation NifU-like protein
MSDDLRDLYQEVILDHSKSPRNFREMPNHDRKIDGYNPLCGDKITLFMKVDEGIVTDVSFQGQGCAISTASASLLTESMKGQPVELADSLYEDFHKLVTTPPDQPIDTENLGKLKVFSGIREFPMRVKCATLCWHALQSALKNNEDAVTTD